MSLKKEKKRLKKSLGRFLDTPEMQAVEVKNPRCRHCKQEIKPGDLVFGD